MRKIISKKAAIKIIVFLFTLIAILSIWPFRVWTEVHSFSASGEPAETSDKIGAEDRILQRFVIRYDKLSSIDLYVEDMKQGRYLSVSILDENASEIFRTYVDTEGCKIPGYVNIPVEMNAEIGKEYYLSIASCRSEYYVGFEEVPEEPDYMGSLFYNWAEIPGRHLNASFNYRLPVAKSVSLIAILALLTFVITVFIVVDLYYRKRPEKNTISTTGKVIRIVANPIAAVFFATLIIMVFPLKVFDSRPADIVFYLLGLIISAGIVFYAINHKVVSYSFGISFWEDVDNKDKNIYVLMMASIAMAIWYASEYMNDLYDIYHTLSERRMVICLLLLIILTFSLKQVVNLYNLIWLVLSGVYGAAYYKSNALDITEKEYDLHNAALKLGIAVIILSGIVVLNLVREVIGRFHERFVIKLSKFGFVLVLFFTAIIVFRNTRLWGIWLVLIFSALYLRLFFWKGTKDWYKILSGGLMMNFAISLLFSFVHRYFTGFVSGRFAFIFHTVTVTAEYLTFMAAAAAVMLTIKVVSFPSEYKAVSLFKSAWKETVLFGFIISYAIFTVSRTAYLAIGVCVLGVIFVAITVKGQKRKLLRIIGTMAVSVLLCFPAAFTMQRIIPVMVADPVFYPIDDADASVRGGAAWDSTNFMCVERFISLFSSKILGMESGSYEYPIDKYNYNSDGTPVYDENGYLIGRNYYEIENAVPCEGLLVSNAFTRAEYFMLLDELNGYVDMGDKLDVISNGRITIFKSYLQELNLYGHEAMGAELPNGEIAVHAHNTYIQVAYDNGIITGVLFAVLMICSLIISIKMYRKNEKKDPLTLTAFAMTIGFAVAGMTEWVFHLCNPMTVALFLSFAGMIYKERKYER